MTDTAKRNVILTVLAVMGVLLAGSGLVLTGAFDLRGWWRSLEMDKHPVEDTELLYAHATLRYQDNDNLSAGTLARRILYLNPRDVRARKLLAAVALRQKDFATAERECQEALRIDPTDMTARIGLGTALRARGKLAEAAAAFKGVEDNTETGQHRDEANLHLLQIEKELRELAAKDKAAEKTLENVSTVLHSGDAAPPPTPRPLFDASPTPSPSPTPAGDLLAPPPGVVSPPADPAGDGAAGTGVSDALPGVRP